METESYLLNFLLEAIHFQADPKSFYAYAENACRTIPRMSPIRFTVLESPKTSRRKDPVRDWLGSQDRLSQIIPLAECPPPVRRQIKPDRKHKFLLPIWNNLFMAECHGFILVPFCEANILGFFQILAALTGMKMGLFQISERLPAMMSGYQLGRIAQDTIHEIKNKLITPSTFFQTLQERKEDPRFMEHFAPLAAQELNLLSRQVERFLQYGRKDTLARKSISVPAALTLDHCLILLEPEFEKYKIHLTKKLDPSLDLPLDSQNVKDVTFNLLLNAIQAMRSMKQGRKLGVIMFSGKKEKGFRVKDNGPGIPVSARKRVFEPFFTSKEDGTGLGLCIVRQVIEDAGGNLTFQSRSGYTVFRVAFPV